VVACSIVRGLVIAFVALAASSAPAAGHKKAGVSTKAGAKTKAAPVAPSAKARKAPVDAPELLFTFDDGPAIDKTPKVLDLLDQHHIKAVFFVNGWHFLGHRPVEEKAREILREELRRGHAVGNHTVHHYFLCGRVYSLRAAQEIEENASLIEQAIGIRPDLFRTPYGAHCPSLAATLAGLGIKHTGWDIDPQDWKIRNAAKIEAYVTSQLANLHGRAIILFHDVQGETVKALPHILDWIDAENARREKDKSRPPIKILDYAYLVPPHPLMPPPLDSLGRLLIACFKRAAAPPLTFWPRLAWLDGQV
jgi:peptidoglycan-N-acetylglucosamine deacetylase